MKIVTKVLIISLVVLYAQVTNAKPNSADSSIVLLVDSTFTYYLNEYDFSDSAKTKWKKEEEISPEEFVDSKEIWIRIPLPKINYNNPAILLIGFYSNLEIYLDSILVFDRIYVDKEDYLNFNENIILLKDFGKKDYILLRMRYGNWYNVGGFDTVILGEVSELLEYSTERDLDELLLIAINIAVGAILIIMSFLSIFLFLKRRALKYYPFINFALIAFLAGIDHFIETTLIFIIPVPLLLIIYTQLISVLIIPIAFTILINQIFGPSWKSFFKHFWKFHSFISVIYISLTLYNFEYFFILPELYLLIILEILLFVFVFYKSQFHKKRGSKYVFYAMFFFLFSALLDLLESIGLFQWNVELYGIGIIIISLSLINLLLNNYSEKVKKVEDYEIKVKEKELELIKLKKENLQSQYEALKNQVNPHFLFNTFSTLMNVIEEDQQNGINFVQKLSNIYRYVLQSKYQDFVKVEDEINFINSFIFLLEKRFENGIIVRINIPDKYKSYKIIPLSLQLLVENCIKHNIVSEKKPLIIDIFINSDGVLIVKNNLQIKRIFGNSTKIGLENIKSRYKLLTNKEVGIVKSKSSFEVKIPLFKA